MSRSVSIRKIQSFSLSFFREPLNIALFLFLPLVGIELYSSALGAFPSALFTDLQADPATVGRISGAIFATAALAGVLGLFQVISARKTDLRLLICGSSQSGLLVSRLLTITLFSLFIAGISVLILSRNVAIEEYFLAFGVLTIVGLLYSLLGILIGSLIPRELEGSLVLVFLADMDNVLASNIIKVDAVFGKVFPLYYPHQLFQSAIIDGTVPMENLVFVGIYLVLLTIVTVVVYLRTTETGGVVA